MKRLALVAWVVMLAGVAAAQSPGVPGKFFRIDDGTDTRTMDVAWYDSLATAASVALKLPIANPTFTGTLTGPTGTFTSLNVGAYNLVADFATTAMLWNYLLKSGGVVSATQSGTGVEDSILRVNSENNPTNGALFGVTNEDNLRFLIDAEGDATLAGSMNTAALIINGTGRINSGGVATLAAGSTVGAYTVDQDFATTASDAAKLPLAGGTMTGTATTPQVIVTSATEGLYYRDIDPLNDNEHSFYISSRPAATGYDVSASRFEGAAVATVTGAQGLAMALDVIPGAGATDFTGNGLAWIDVLSTDNTRANEPMTYARVGNHGTKVEFGSRSYGTASPAVELSVGGSPAVRLRTDLKTAFMDGTNEHAHSYLYSGNSWMQAQSTYGMVLASLASFVNIKAAAGQAMYFDAGGIFWWRDSDAGFANRASMDSATGDLATSGALTAAGTVQGSTLKGTGLTSGRVPYVTTGGALTDASTLTFSAGTLTATAFSGSGASLTNLNGSNMASGTVADARLSSNIPLKNAANTFTSTLQATGVGVNIAPSTIPLYVADADAVDGGDYVAIFKDAAYATALVIGSGSANGVWSLGVPSGAIDGTLKIENTNTGGMNLEVLDGYASISYQKHADRGAHPSLASGECATYRKGNLYVVAYNDGGTVKYRYLNLASTDATWTYTTTAP